MSIKQMIGELRSMKLTAVDWVYRHRCGKFHERTIREAVDFYRRRNSWILSTVECLCVW